MENKLLQALEMMVGEASLQDPFGDEGSREILELARSVIAEAKAHLTQRALDAATVAPKCTTEKLCPVHNVWHAAPPRK